MNDRALVREQAREIRRMKQLAADVWAGDRAELASRCGPGFFRHTGKPGARMVKQAVGRCLDAGIEWRDIETGLLVTSRAMRSPWYIFDAALEAQAEREARERMMEKMRDDRPRVAGLHHIGATGAAGR